MDEHVMHHWDGENIACGQDLYAVLLKDDLMLPVCQPFMPVAKRLPSYGMLVTVEIQFHHCLMGLLILYHVMAVFAGIETTHTIILTPDFQMDKLMEIEDEGIQ